jgi:hypothetical protein
MSRRFINCIEWWIQKDVEAKRQCPTLRCLLYQPGESEDNNKKARTVLQAEIRTHNFSNLVPTYDCGKFMSNYLPTSKRELNVSVKVRPTL